MLLGQKTDKGCVVEGKKIPAIILSVTVEGGNPYLSNTISHNLLLEVDTKIKVRATAWL